MKLVFLGIGTNLGDRESNLKAAVNRIEKTIGKVLKSSALYETEPWGFQAEQEFLNMVVKVETMLSPLRLLAEILLIESQMGRVRGEKQYSSRVIDIDILLYENMIIAERTLQVPHSLMHERKFVLVPLCEIGPEIMHPVFMKTMASLLESCEDKSIVRKYS